MIEKSVLILGAGSDVDCGYPAGQQLIKNLASWDIGKQLYCRHHSYTLFSDL